MTLVRLLYFIGAGLVFSYLVRVSVLPLWAGPTAGQLLAQGSRAMLVVALLAIVLDKRGFRFTRTGVFFLALTFPGTLALDDFSQAFLKWAGWVLVALVLGPVIRGVHAQRIRAAAWVTFKYGFIAIAIASCLWYFARLPVLGRGVFTGVMTHSMLVGPMAAMAVIFCGHRAIERRSLPYSLAAFGALIPCLLSGSRVAVVAMTVAMLALLLLAVLRVGFRKSIPIVAVTLFLGGLGGIYVYSVVESDHYYQMVAKLEEKGLQNTRESLWTARVNEFLDYPVTGVGVGMGVAPSREAMMRTGVVQGEADEINIEPGSSWLALLSMTGLAGALGFAILSVRLFRDFKKTTTLRITDAECIEILVILLFLTIHMIAEGYIFAVGNAFCLLFWLTLGRLQDVSMAGTRGGGDDMARRARA